MSNLSEKVRQRMPEKRLTSGSCITSATSTSTQSTLGAADLEPKFVCSACGKRGMTSGRIFTGTSRACSPAAIDRQKNKARHSRRAPGRNRTSNLPRHSKVVFDVHHDLANFRTPHMFEVSHAALATFSGPACSMARM
jgi:hypothetical protein